MVPNESITVEPFRGSIARHRCPNSDVNIQSLSDVNIFGGGESQVPADPAAKYPPVTTSCP